MTAPGVLDSDFGTVAFAPGFGPAGGFGTAAGNFGGGFGVAGAFGDCSAGAGAASVGVGLGGGLGVVLGGGLGVVLGGGLGGCLGIASSATARGLVHWVFFVSA